MARRNSSNDSTSPVTDEATPVTTDETAPAAEDSSAPAPAADEKKDDAPVDLSAFTDSVAAALTDADDSTGEVTVEGLSKSNEAYRALDGLKAKNAARKWLDDAMMEAIFGSNAQGARSYAQIKENLSAGSSAGTKAPKDPTENFVGRIATLQAALNVAFADVPEGVSDDWAAKADEKATSLTEAATSYKASVKAATDEAPFDDAEVGADVKKVVKLASGKATGGTGGSYTGGPRRSVGNHIEQVFASLEPGSYLTVTEINQARSEEYGPDDAPTTGAISQKLFGAKGKPVTYTSDAVKAVNDGERARGAERI